MSRRWLVVAAATAALVLAGPVPAHAHPLGNATVNHYDGLTVRPDRIDDHAVEDLAEIPELQRRGAVDTDGDGRLTAAERHRYAADRCAALASAVRIEVDGRRVAMRVLAAAFAERSGAIGLTVGRLDCRLTGSADLRRGGTVAIRDAWDGAGLGWHEMTARASGVALRGSPLPARSVSDQLRHYPGDLLASPLNVRSARLVVAAVGPSSYAETRDLPSAGLPTRLLGRVSGTVDRVVGARHLGLGVGLLAVLLAMLLGAGHAFLPGHGKTVMAAYLVGRRGRLRDVVVVGATVTLTHTIGVLALGLAVSLSASFAPTVVEQDLAVVSGLIVAAVGAGLLLGALRRRGGGPLTAGHDHPHHPHGHGHPHEHEHGQAHGPHAHRPEAGFGRAGLVGLGAAGGLVPSPSALLVLLGAAALGRTAYGVLLVLAYGVGMAAALTAAGLVLVRLRGRVLAMVASGRLAGAARLAAALPVVTAVLVLAVGLGLVSRAVAGGI